MTLEQNLCAAIWNGRLTEAKQHIANGANINYIDEYGWTPLHLALRTGQIDFAKALIIYGADINKISLNTDSISPLDIIKEQNLQIRLNKEEIFKDEIKTSLADNIRHIEQSEGIVTIIPGIKVNLFSLIEHDSNLDKAATYIYNQFLHSKNISKAFDSIEKFSQELSEYNTIPNLIQNIFPLLIGVKPMFISSLPAGNILNMAGINDIVRIEDTNEVPSSSLLSEAQENFNSLKNTNILITDLTFETRVSAIVKAQLQDIDWTNLGSAVIGCSPVDCGTTKDHTSNDLFFTGWTSDPRNPRIIKHFDFTKIKNWELVKEVLEANNITPESRFASLIDHTYEILAQFNQKEHIRTSEESHIMKEILEYVQLHILRPGGEIKYYDSITNSDIDFPVSILGEYEEHETNFTLYSGDFNNIA